jgi:hypothetical protein
MHSGVKPQLNVHDGIYLVFMFGHDEASCA